MKEKLSIEEIIAHCKKTVSNLEKYRKPYLDDISNIDAKEYWEHRQVKGYLLKLKKYQAIGTPEKCRAAMEKQKAKKPIRNDKCTCPSCGTYNEVFKKRRNTVYSDIVYCWHCGQALKIFRSDEE